jgi:hypothetical protein
MSMSGEQRLELERQRLEALRLDQVREECTALVSACEAMLADVRNVVVQQIAAPALRRGLEQLRTLRERIQESPDETRGKLLQVSSGMHEEIAKAEGKAEAWSQRQAEVIGRARGAGHLAAANGAAAAEAQSLSQQAEAHAKSGDLAAAEMLIARAHTAVETAAAAKLDESVRREVVRGLVRTLNDMGFVVTGPQLDAGRVVLEGRLASGRRARFEVFLDGKMKFDLDGYEDRTCAPDMEKVETALRDRFGVRLGPKQVEWKNPDRIGKTARDLPPGEQRRK